MSQILRLKDLISIFIVDLYKPNNQGSVAKISSHVKNINAVFDLRSSRPRALPLLASHRTVRETLASYGSSCPTLYHRLLLPVRKNLRIMNPSKINPLSCLH